MSERRANPILDLAWDLQDGRLNAREAIGELVRLAAGREDQRALVDEAISVGLLREEQRASVTRLLDRAPEEARSFLEEDIGLAGVRQLRGWLGLETPTRTLTARTEEDREYEAWFAKLP